MANDPHAQYTDNNLKALYGLLNTEIAVAQANLKAIEAEMRKRGLVPIKKEGRA